MYTKHSGCLMSGASLLKIHSLGLEILSFILKSYGEKYLDYIYKFLFVGFHQFVVETTWKESSGLLTLQSVELDAATWFGKMNVTAALENAIVLHFDQVWIQNLSPCTISFNQYALGLCCII